MGSYQILLADGNPQSFHEEQKNSKLESQELTLNEEILNMLKIMSHDIRGALVSMSATLKLLSRGYYGKIDEGAANNLKDLLSKTIGLIGITEEYLGRAFSIDDDLEVEEGVSDLKQDIIDPVLEELLLEIRDRRIQIDNRLDPFLYHPIPIKGGKIWLKTVFRNLFKNAIKYGDNGGTISIGFENNGPFYRLNVYNDGKPVPEEWRSKLFTKFLHIGNGTNGNGSANGMGLGLYLTKKIIKKHVGEIWYEAKDHGSNFVFTFPAGA